MLVLSRIALQFAPDMAFLRAEYLLFVTPAPPGRVITTTANCYSLHSHRGMWNCYRR